MKKDHDEPYSEEDAERRTIELIRRSFAMPYKPQSEMVGKVGRTAKTRSAPKGSVRKGKSRA